MSSFHFESKIINRKTRSVTAAVSYIAGKNLHDVYRGKTCYKKREDVEYFRIFLPANAPIEFSEPQILCNAVEKAENRQNSRTARVFIGSLPNELSSRDQIKIVDEFVTNNFVKYGLGAIVAIHSGMNKNNRFNDNPHVHIVVTTRTINADGFSKTKFRDLDEPHRVSEWRKSWADLQNMAYERHGLSERVSHESFEKQGIKREPKKHLSLFGWKRKQQRERHRDLELSR